MTFANHGCNGTYNFGTPTSSSEATLELGVPVLSVYDARNDPFNPFIERRYFTLELTHMIAVKDIAAGEELLDNYLPYGGGDDQHDFDANLAELKAMCMGGKGVVSEYEQQES
jgi:hypothetical protein